MLSFLSELFFSFLSAFEKHSRRWLHLQLATLFILCIAAGGALSVYLGVDSNFDLKNYHLYNAWAFFANRAGTDFFPAGLQGFFQPLLDLPYYLLAVEWFPDKPRLVTFLMGVPAGLLFFLTFLAIFLSLGETPNLSRTLRYFYTALLGFFGLTSATILFQVGSTTNEIQAAVPVLGAVITFLAARKKIAFSAILSGALLGIAAGSKLTALTYTLPFLAALLFYHKTWNERARTFIWFCAAWWIAFLAIYGWWAWTIYGRTGNPLFPFYNNIFRSPLIPPINLEDPWFRPQTWKETLFFPFYWVNTRAVSESYCTDVRFLLTQSAVCIAGIFALLRYLTRKKKVIIETAISAFEIASAKPPAPAKNTASRLPLFFFIFLVCSFIFWEKQFSILRYTVPFAALVGLLVFLALNNIAGGFKTLENRAKNLLIISALAFFTIVSVSTARYPHWGRLRGEKQVFNVSQLPKLEDNTLVVFAGPECSFLAPFFAKQNTKISFVSTAGDPRILLMKLRNSELTKKVRERIEKHNGPVRVLVSNGYREQVKYMPAFGLAITPSGATSPLYQTFDTNYDSFRLYYAERFGSTGSTGAPAAPSLTPPAEKKRFIENTMTNFQTAWSAADNFRFERGWNSVERRNGFTWRWSEGESSTVLFFLREPDTTRTTLRITGRPRGAQRATVTLNGTRLFSGEILTDGFPEISIPAGTLRDVNTGENRLEFFWSNAIRHDNRPWPDGPRPGYGDRRVVAFGLQEITIE